MYEIMLSMTVSGAAQTGNVEAYVPKIRTIDDDTHEIALLPKSNFVSIVDEAKWSGNDSGIGVDDADGDASDEAALDCAVHIPVDDGCKSQLDALDKTGNGQSLQNEELPRRNMGDGERHIDAEDGKLEHDIPPLFVDTLISDSPGTPYLCQMCHHYPSYQQWNCGHHGCRRCSDALLACAHCGTHITERWTVSNSSLLGGLNSSIADLSVQAHGVPSEHEVEECSYLTHDGGIRNPDSSSGGTWQPRCSHRAPVVGNAAVLEPCAFCNCCTTASRLDSSSASTLSVRSGNPVALEVTCEGGCRHRSCGACVATLSQGCPDCGRGIQSMKPLNTSSPTGDTDGIRHSELPVPKEAPPPAEATSATDAILSFFGMRPSKHKGNVRDKRSVGVSSPGSCDPPQQRPPCQICENRPQTTQLDCGNGCEVVACGSCATKQKERCFVCKRNGVTVTPLAQDSLGFSPRKVGCDLCGSRRRTHAMTCQQGCYFRTCATCVRSLTHCCALPLARIQRISGSDTGEDAARGAGTRQRRSGALAVGAQAHGSGTSVSGNASPQGTHGTDAWASPRSCSPAQLDASDVSPSSPHPSLRSSRRALFRFRMKQDADGATGNAWLPTPVPPKHFFDRKQYEHIMQQVLAPISHSGGFMGY
eukprot:m.677501 g.677501  ORF g.677501 m.677501 type:complete len:647 (+) comp22797_c0_seq2:313-2253(+)